MERPTLCNPEKILNEWREIGKKGNKLEEEWNKVYDNLSQGTRKEFEDFRHGINIKSLEDVIIAEKKIF